MVGDAYYTPNNTIRGQLQAIRNLTNNEYYSNFKKSVAIEGVFDDHDYGVNDAGKSITNYIDRKKQYLEFLYDINLYTTTTSTTNIDDHNNHEKIILYLKNKMESNGFIYDDYSKNKLFQFIKTSTSSITTTSDQSHSSASASSISMNQKNVQCNNNNKDDENDDNNICTTTTTSSELNDRGVYKSFDIFLTTSDTKIKSKIKVIMLDTRSFRDYHYIPSVGKYLYIKTKIGL